MKTSKIYTAQEIREMEAIVASGDIGPMTRERVALMLKQAAEMLERCEEVADIRRRLKVAEDALGKLKTICEQTEYSYGRSICEEALASIDKKESEVK